MSRKKLSRIRAEMRSALIERDLEIDLALTALLAREHCLLVGPPGTGKSFLCDMLVDRLHGDKFSILLTKFTDPSETCGPMDLAKLKENKYQRETTGTLVDSHIAFVDEIFKASSAILNTLLKILNERKYKNGTTMINCPLLLCLAASNEWPNEEEELGALFDRFLFRKVVKPIATHRGLEQLLWGTIDTTPKTFLSPAELEIAANEVAAVAWSKQAKEALLAILREVKKEGIIPSDRRQRKSVMAARAYAYLMESDVVLPEHLEILQHVLWDDPNEQPRKVAEVVMKIANPESMRINGLLAEANELVDKTDHHDPMQLKSSSVKLEEIQKKLQSAGGVRAESAAEYVADEAKRMRIAYVENTW